jgi:hypothetical protein
MLLASVASPARADPAADEERARQLFDAGHAAADAGDPVSACRMFEQSLALVRRASTLLNLGACNEALGKLATAVVFFEEGLAMLDPRDDRAAPARLRIAAIGPKVARLHVEPPADLPPGSVITLDGAELAPPALADELRIDPGRHEIRLQAPGRLPLQVVVLAAEGSRDAIALELGAPLPPPPPPPVPPPPPAPSAPPVVPADTDAGGIPVWVWPVGAIGLAAGIAAIPFAVDYARTVSSQEDLCGGELEQCRPTPPGSYDPADDNATKRRDAIAGAVLAAAGGAAFTAAIIGAAVGASSSAAGSARVRVRFAGVVVAF